MITRKGLDRGLRISIQRLHESELKLLDSVAAASFVDEFGL